MPAVSAPRIRRRWPSLGPITPRDFRDSVRSMAIRGPHGPKPPPPEAGVRPAREQAVSPLQRLVDFGAARTPQEARRLVQELLASLRAAGFPVPATGGAESQLGQALKLFQQSQGLPADGRLDRDTLGALLDAGVLVPPKDAGEAGGTRDAGGVAHPSEPALPERLFGLPKFLGDRRALPVTGGATPEGAKAVHDVEAAQKADAKDKPPEIDLKGFLSSLRAAGFYGAGKGAEQLKDALKKVQRSEGLPQSGQLDVRTAEALARRGVLSESALAVIARESPTSQATSGSRSESAVAMSDPTARGLPEGALDPDARVGRGEGQGSAPGRAGEGGDGTSASTSTQLGQAPGNAVAREGEALEGALDDAWGYDDGGNAPAGDDDVDDERRGHASLDDGGDAEAGHWRVPTLSEQIRAGLEGIARDDDGAGAATYAWDFTLYRPGVYGARQPSERLFHLVVERAGPFDPLWERARLALNDKLAALEPETRALEAGDFERALRRARVRTLNDR